MELAIRNRGMEGDNRSAGPRGEGSADDDLVSALVDVRLGEMIDKTKRAPELESFALAIPELLASQRISGSVVIGHLDHAVSADFHDIVLVSRRRIHVAQRLPDNPRIALVGVAPRTRSVGLILSEARARLTQS